MIKMIKGTYGVNIKGKTVAMTKKSAPFSLSQTEEKRLVDAGVAVFANDEKKENKRQPLQPPMKTEPDETAADKKEV